MSHNVRNMAPEWDRVSNWLKLPFLLACFLCPQHISAQVVANFTASATSGCPPFVINFTNTSTGATSYSWDLGNSNTSLMQDASTSYVAPGTYTVTLTAYNGASSDTKSIQVVISPLPVVSFSTTDTAICPGTQVSFTNTTNPASAGAATYYWDFGDGNSSTQQNATHSYQVPGYYSVTLTTTNSDGCNSSLVMNSYIHVRTKPVAAFTAGNSSFCTLPAAVSFTSQATGAGPLSYSWDFGDGSSPSALAAPTHSYSAAGAYAVRQIVTDANGCTDSISNTETIATGRLQASFVLPDSACVNTPVSITNTTATTFISNVWDYGDGNTYTGGNPGNTYTAPGTYTVTLVIYNGSCYDTVKHNIKIKQGPTITLSSTPLQPCPAPTTIQFTTTAPAGTSYKWYWGDGDSSTTASPSHLYQDNGFYKVTLTATNFCPTVITDSVKIYDFLPSYVLLPKDIGCAPLIINFSFSASTSIPPSIPTVLKPFPYPITSYRYDFGDGSPVVTTSAATHTYTTAGAYESSITLTFGNGCSAFFTDSVHVGYMPVIDSYSVSSTHVCKHDQLIFKGKATGVEPLHYEYVVDPTSPDSLMLLSGDDDTSAIYTYPSPGTYQTHLVVSNYGCYSAISPKITIIVDSPEARISPANYRLPLYSCTNKLAVTLFDSSIGATSLLWLFGDGDTSSAKDPTHIYPTAGNYSPLLTVANNTSGCKDTIVAYSLQFSNLIPVILAPDTAICQNSILMLTPSYISSSIVPTSYSYFVNGTLIGMSIPPPLPAPFLFPSQTMGYNTVMLVEMDSHNCLDTGFKTIFVSQPAAGFKATPVEACIPSAVIFIDTTYDNPGAYITTRAWTWGDLTANTVTTATTGHPYNTPGFYSIKEVVTDNNGCMDSVYKNNYISAHKANASFATVNTNHCPGDTITFVNINAASLMAASWNFGDGTTSTALAPVHTYSNPGSYTISVIVTDTAGCRDTLVKTAYINITKPHAAFTENDSTGVCPPLVVNLTNTSTGAASYNWAFGNTNTSVTTNPTSSYSTPGNYVIQLIATDAHGCKDTAYHQVSLYGYSGTFTYTPLSGCPPLAVNFTANITNIPSISWDFSDGTVTPPSANNTISHVYTAPGKFLPRVILGDGAGCYTTIAGADTIRVDKAVARFTETAAICLYDTVHFTDNSSSLFSPVNSWTWNLGDGSGTTFTQNPTHTYHTAGNFSVTLVAGDVAGCKDTIVNAITVHALPGITTTGDTTICPGDSAIVTAKGGVSFLWAAVNAIACTTCNPTYIVPTTPGNYVVTGTDAFGCKNTDSVTIGFTYKTVSYAGPGGEICNGQSITLRDSGAQKYSWYPDVALSNNDSASTTASPTYNITYLAIAQTASCIPDTNTIMIIVNPVSQVTAQGSAIVLAGAQVNLQAYGAGIVSFMWNNADILSCDDCSAPIATMQQTTQFTVTGTNQYGCEDSAHVTVDVLCDKSQVFIPNTFTPNGDGQNDIFYPRGVGIRIVKSFRIYNRWGELVFERNDIQLNDEQSGWDGTFNGAKPVPDTYVYAVDAICDDGKPIDWKGDVTLIK